MIFVDMQRFAEEDLSNQSVNSLKKGIRSLKKVIALHEDKILNRIEELKKRGEDFDEVDC